MCKCRYQLDDGDESWDIYTANSVTYLPPTVPVLLQILSGAQDSSDPPPNGSVYDSELSKVVRRCTLLTLVVL
jgi:hypothetical protein